MILTCITFSSRSSLVPLAPTGTIVAMLLAIASISLVTTGAALPTLKAVRSDPLALVASAEIVAIAALEICHESREDQNRRLSSENIELVLAAILLPLFALRLGYLLYEWITIRRHTQIESRVCITEEGGDEVDREGEAIRVRLLGAGGGGCKAKNVGVAL